MAPFLVPSCPLSTDFQPENGEEDREVNLLRAKYLKVTSFGKLSFCRCFSVPPGLGGQILVVNAFTDFFFFCLLLFCGILMTAGRRGICWFRAEE